jgi:beta-lactamase class D
MLATFERPLSPSLTFKVASAMVKFQGKPAVRSENRSRLLWVGSEPPSRKAAVVRWRAGGANG